MTTQEFLNEMDKAWLFHVQETKDNLLFLNLSREEIHYLSLAWRMQWLREQKLEIKFV